MGLFEDPYPAAPESQWSQLINNAEAKQVARDLDKESIVLLENHNQTLPLKKSGSIAVIGPMAYGFMNVSRNLRSHSLTHSLYLSLSLLSKWLDLSSSYSPFLSSMAITSSMKVSTVESPR